MDCTREEPETANVFRLDILVPLMKMLDIYMSSKRDLSPDEFCIVLLARRKVSGRCTFDPNALELYLDNFDGFEIPPNLLQDVIVDLFMNIIRYEVLLDAVSKDFLKKQQCRNFDGSRQIMVLVYILVYRIFNLSFNESVECFVHFTITKISSLVSYLLREETQNFFYKVGCSVFEEDFVEQKLILPLMEATSCLEDLQERLKEQKRRMEKPRKPLTKPVAMNVLNHAKKFLKVPPPTPDDLTTLTFACEIPRTNYVKPSTERKLVSLRALNKLQAITLLNDANIKAPSCSRPRKDFSEPSKKEEQPLPIFVRRSAPIFKPVTVKQTTASILRECARIVNDETKEMKKLKELEEGGFDPLSIEKLEEEGRLREKEKEMQKIEEKHLTALLIREDAIIAKQSLLNDVKLHAENVRREKRELYEKLEKWKEDHGKEMSEIVEKCREIEQASRDAFNSMINEKRQRAAEVTEESRQLRIQRMKQREEEMRKKVQMIQEIKAIQSVRPLTFKEFDPTESSGLGLLCEMPLAELKERLFWMKMKLHEEIDDRKAIIHRERKRQKNLINDTRKALEEYKIDKRSSSSRKIQDHATLTTTPEIDSLRKKLEERRALRLRK